MSELKREEFIRFLTKIIEEAQLSEIEYKEKDMEVRLSKINNISSSVQFSSFPQLKQDEHFLKQAESIQKQDPISLSLSEHPGAIIAPLVGVVYVSSQPGSPPFIKVGDTVAEGQTLLIIEAMKVLNTIKSPRAGKVVQILVENAMPVEYGEVLLIIE